MSPELELSSAFHFDELRTEDSGFQHDCDTLTSFRSVRSLLDFLDSDTSLRDLFELHGDLFDFLVHHPDLSDDFDSSCSFIDLHLWLGSGRAGHVAGAGGEGCGTARTPPACPDSPATHRPAGEPVNPVASPHRRTVDL